MSEDKPLSAGIVPMLIQHPANANAQNALNLKGDDEAGGLDCVHRFDVEATKVNILEELLQRML